ncbi:MAG: hypothetical protein IPL26_02750 [Leptospiraceae bacterium]|nr:hypothetical protein [Leptospiraceae bacterium]
MNSKANLKMLENSNELINRALFGSWAKAGGSLSNSVNFLLACSIAWLKETERAMDRKPTAKCFQVHGGLTIIQSFPLLRNENNDSVR